MRNTSTVFDAQHILLIIVGLFHHHTGEHGVRVSPESGVKRPSKPLNLLLTAVHVSDRLRPIHEANLRLGSDKRRMQWTNERPKLAGVYWHRATRAASSHPVKVYNVGMLFYVWPIEEDGRADITVRLDDCSGEWAGPIIPPA